MSALAIIPARGGSRRIPGKNIRPFLGKPMIAYAIEAAHACGAFDRLLVSTDSPEIAEVARREGAEVPFLRSAASSGDHATLAEAVSDALAAWSSENGHPDRFCCILPTCPLLDPRDLRSAEALLDGAPEVLSVVRFGYPIWRALRCEEGAVSMIWPEHERARSQDLPEAFHDAGMFYWLRTSAFLGSRSFFLPGAKAWEIPESRVQDIDTPEDWRLAELKYAALHPAIPKEEASP